MSAIARILLARAAKRFPGRTRADAVARSAARRRRARDHRARRRKRSRRAHRRRQFGDRSPQSRVCRRPPPRHPGAASRRDARATAARPPGHRGVRNARKNDDHGDDACRIARRRNRRRPGVRRHRRLAADQRPRWHRAVVRHRSRRVRRLLCAARTAIAIVTNIENDHLGSDDELPALVRAFGEFLGKLPRRRSGDRSASTTRCPRPCTRTTARAGRDVRLGAQATCVPQHVRFDDLRLAVRRDRRRRRAGQRRAARPRGDERSKRARGDRRRPRARSAVRRASPALYASFAACAAGSTFWWRTTARRVVDDYAHHPTAVRATIAAARQLPPRPAGRRLSTASLYAHGVSCARVRATRCAAPIDVYLAPIYAASEPAIPGVSERSIGDPLDRDRRDACSYVARVDALEERLLDETSARRAWC